MSDSRRKARRRQGKAWITPTAMATYIEALAEGENHETAARRAGFSRGAFWRLRKRDPEFAATCEEAIERSCGKRFVHGGAKRKLQMRRNRRTLFTPDRQAIFLDHFAGTANAAEAAAKAGVCEATVDAHRRKDEEFNRCYLEALDQSFPKLVADVTARRLAEQKRLREREPTGEIEPEFERAMRLIERWDRRRGTPDKGAAGHGAQERWDFPESALLLERKLRNLAIGIQPLPPGYERPDGHLPLPPSGPAKESGERGR